MRNALKRNLVKRTLGVLAAVLLLVAAPACDGDTGGCKDDYDCPNHQVCLRSKGACDDPKCSTDADCPIDGQVCQHHECVEPTAE